MTTGAGRSRSRAWPRLLAVAIVALILLWGAFTLYAAGQPLLGAIILGLTTGFVVIFGSDRFYGSRFIFPGIAAVLVFIAFPVIYTIYIGFTNYSSSNLLTYPRAVEVLTARGTVDQSTEQPFAVARDGDEYRIWLPESGLLSDPVPLTEEGTAALSPADAPEALLDRREAVALREGLARLTLETPEGQLIRNAGPVSYTHLTLPTTPYV